MKSKESIWKGYFSKYIKGAREKNVDPLEVLDKEWSDGFSTSRNVIPYINRDSIVLEIASGIGRVSRYIAPECNKLYCTDILEDALSILRENMKKFNNICYYKINGYDLKLFNDNLFDCVFSFTTFSHFDFELVVQYFSEIHRVLKQNGTAIIAFKKWVSEQDLLQLLEKIERKGGIVKYESKIDKWRYVSKDMLKIICDYYGFTVIEDDVTKYTIRKI